MPLDIFQIDDGFTPEMGDWLDVKPQFPRGMAPLLADIAAAGFHAGPVDRALSGRQSQPKLFAAHPDWVVQRSRLRGGPLVAMRFYGEFRWHKRSARNITSSTSPIPTPPPTSLHVFRTWARDWGARLFQGRLPARTGWNMVQIARVWHEAGLSRVAIWRRMVTLIREELGEDVIVSGCGCPLWASVGLVDAVRIGRDVGVTWHGDYSAESLLRDLADPQPRQRHPLAGRPGLRPAARPLPRADRRAGRARWRCSRDSPAGC